MLKNGCKCYNIQKPLVYMRVGEEFYKRRGGFKYLKSILRLINIKLKSGYCSLGEAIRTFIPRIIIYLMPNKAREIIYRKLLRK